MKKPIQTHISFHLTEEGRILHRVQPRSGQMIEGKLKKAKKTAKCGNGIYCHIAAFSRTPV